MVLKTWQVLRNRLVSNKYVKLTRILMQIQKPKYHSSRKLSRRKSRKPKYHVPRRPDKNFVQHVPTRYFFKYFHHFSIILCRTSNSLQRSTRFVSRLTIKPSPRQGRHSCVKSNKRHEIHETNLHDTKRLFFSCKNRIFFGSKFGLKINSSSHLSLLGHKYECINYG